MRRMARSIVTSLVGIVTLASCGTASVSGHPCESPSTRQAWEDCRPPTASEVLGAELLIAALETPISRAAAEYVIASTEPGLTASVAYFVVPSDGPETAGRMGLESGLDGVVAAVAEAFSEDGRTGADRLLIHAIGFVPGAEERGIDEALEVLADAGFEMYLCTTPGFRGGCGVPSP